MLNNKKTIKTMKTKRFFTMMLAALMVVATPASLWAQTEEVEQPATVEEQPTETHTTTQASVTVNGKPITTGQKAVARQMARQ